MQRTHTLPPVVALVVFQVIVRPAQLSKQEAQLLHLCHTHRWSGVQHTVAQVNEENLQARGGIGHSHLNSKREKKGRAWALPSYVLSGA